MLRDAMKNFLNKNKVNKQIDKLLESIRADYNILLEKYKRPSTLRRQFDDRYREALRSKVNLLKFLKNENEVVKTLLLRFEERAEETKLEKIKPEKQEKQTGFADKIIESFENRIKKYPAIILHPDASQEIKRLFGAIAVLEKEHWVKIDYLIRKTASSKHSENSLDLYPEINRMVNSNSIGVPSALSTYLSLLSLPMRNYIKVEQEEKRCLVRIAVFLTKLQMVITETIDMENNLKKEDLDILKDALHYTEAIIEDFRLKDLGRLA